MRRDQDDTETLSYESEGLVGKEIRAAVINVFEQYRSAQVAGSINWCPDDYSTHHLDATEAIAHRFSTSRGSPVNSPSFPLRIPPSLLTQAIPVRHLPHFTSSSRCNIGVSDSVVETMWAKADMDGRGVCKRLYRLIFKEKGHARLPLCSGNFTTIFWAQVVQMIPSPSAACKATPSTSAV